MRTLYAFDFDHTIIHGNSDTHVLNLSTTPLPPHLEEFYDGTNWTEFMDRVFGFLHSQGVGAQKIVNFVRDMEPTRGMNQLLVDIHRKIKEEERNHELLIISDANDKFITAFMERIGVVPDSIITNYAEEKEGRLTLKAYEEQYTCQICPKNLCKGRAIQGVLEEAEKKGTPFNSVIYVGDGSNDVCSGIKLNPQDSLFVRSGYSLEKILNRGSVKDRNNKEVIEISVKAKVHFWEDAEVIRREIFKN